MNGTLQGHRIHFDNNESYESLGVVTLRERARKLLDKHSFTVSSNLN